MGGNVKVVVGFGREGRANGVLGFSPRVDSCDEMTMIPHDQHYLGTGTPGVKGLVYFYFLFLFGSLGVLVLVTMERRVGFSFCYWRRALRTVAITWEVFRDSIVRARILRIFGECGGKLLHMSSGKVIGVCLVFSAGIRPGFLSFTRG
jgi:hypothetical protein